MATYYVKTGGGDGNTGLTEALAWATVTKALQTLTANDTVYIAPGTYRNTSGYIMTNAGTSGNEINIIGDPDCEQFTNEDPGYVRLTGCNSSEVPSCSNKLFDFNNKAYINLKNLNFDGQTNAASVYTVNCLNTTDNKLDNCIIHGPYAAVRKGLLTNCIAIGGYDGYNYSVATNCIGIGANHAFVGGTATNCIGIGAYYCFSGTTMYNCISYGGYTGNYSSDINNCIAVGAYRGFYNSTVNNCVAINCQTGYSGSTLTACKALYCHATYSGGTGTPTAANHIGWTDLTKLKSWAKALKYDLYNELDAGDDSVISSVTTDILGDFRRSNDGTIDIGPWEYTDRELDWTNYETNAPGIKINRKGVETFFLPCKSGQAITIKVQVKFNSTANKPSLVTSGGSITTQTDTATSAGSAWEELEVTFTPDYDDRIEVRLQANDTTSAKYSTFSDVEVS